MKEVGSEVKGVGEMEEVVNEVKWVGRDGQ